LPIAHQAKLNVRAVADDPRESIFGVKQAAAHHVVTAVAVRVVVATIPSTIKGVLALIRP
jgi:hypothetical protein